MSIIKRTPKFAVCSASAFGAAAGRLLSAPRRGRTQSEKTAVPRAHGANIHLKEAPYFLSVTDSNGFFISLTAFKSEKFITALRVPLYAAPFVVYINSAADVSLKI